MTNALNVSPEHVEDINKAIVSKKSMFDQGNCVDNLQHLSAQEMMAMENGERSQSQKSRRQELQHENCD